MALGSVGAVYIEEGWVAVIVLARTAVVVDDCVVVFVQLCGIIVNSLHRLVAGVGHAAWGGVGGEVFVVCKCPILDLFKSAVVL